MKREKSPPGNQAANRENKPQPKYRKKPVYSTQCIKRFATKNLKNMNNKIKFRVWDKLAKQYIYSDKGYQGHYLLTLSGGFHNLQNGASGNECVVEQWTGLVDKTGRDIYLGDIISFRYFTDPGWTEFKEDSGEVLFEDAMFCFKKGVLWATNDANFDVESLTIIGNINENPELLQELAKVQDRID
jgi:hypothetical protein